MLNTVTYGDSSDRPLVVAHGLFGSARNWGAVARRLAADRQVVAVDMRNHGDSPRDTDHSYEAMASDLGDVIERFGGRADLLGHSMGGKAAMTLALSEPGMVDRLIVVDIAPVAYDHSQAPLVEAMRGLDLSAVARRSEADAALAAGVPDAGVRAFLLQSLAIGPDGAAWKLNLETLADEMPRIMGFPETAATFPGPALFLVGATSDYVGEDDMPRIRTLFPKARLETIPGAGHWVHAEAPGPFVAAVSGFLAER